MMETERFDVREENLEQSQSHGTAQISK